MKGRFVVSSYHLCSKPATSLTLVVPAVDMQAIAAIYADKKGQDPTRQSPIRLRDMNGR